MSKKRLKGGVMRMEYVREIQRLSELGYSQREICRSVGIGKTSVQSYQQATKVAGLSYSCTKELSDEELRAALQKKLPGKKRKAIQAPDFERLQRELRSRKGVTLLLLWQEWLAEVSQGYSYSTFCRYFREWAKTKDVSLKREYYGGQKCELDYAGARLSWFDIDGTEQVAEIFVAVLCASNYMYVEASESQKLSDFIGSCVRAVEFFGGLSEVIIIDNLKSGVTKSCKYEPELNRVLQEFGEHYSTSIMPTRTRKPKDKSKVEKAVQEAERWILAPLRKERFSSLDEMNQAIKRLLTAVNQRKMYEYQASREELYKQIELPALRPLPESRFIYAQWKQARVSLDYHIQIHNHYYSVPFTLTRQQVWVKCTEKLVEIYHDNKKVAVHSKSNFKFRHSTIPAHMPPNHLAYKSRTAENFVSWATSVGPETLNQVKTLLALPDYKEISFRSILGLQRLEKKFGSKRLEKACQVANQNRSCGQKLVRSLIEQQVDNQLEPQSDISFVAQHANLRGPDYYH